MSLTVSKTDFLLYRECKKNAWLKKHKPEVFYSAELSDFEKAIIETGNEVELVARELFPTGMLIKDRDELGQKKTAELTAAHAQTIFQPVFLKDGFLAAVDILKYEIKADSYTIIEIKASNEIKKDWHPYDLAFQVSLLRRCGLNIAKGCMMHLDPEYVRAGELDKNKLFKISDITETISGIMEEVEKEMTEALEYLSNDKEPSGPCECVYKGRSNHCTTFSYSNPHIPGYSIHDIARIGVSKNKLTELIDGNVFTLENVPESMKLSEIQQNQVNVHISKRPLIRADKIAEEFRSLHFPLYFLDYETFPCALPRFDGFSPYQQIPFQYSLHVAEKPEKEPVHFEFLYEEQSNPSRAFADSLRKDIGKIGTIIVWNKKFERTINEQIAERLPDFRLFIEDINSRVYDLMDIFSKQYHVHHDFRGSTSIKYVLPVLAPELSYKDLTIREGGTASQKWNEMTTGNISHEDKNRIAEDLKKYCQRDTYAMYAIWKHLYDNVI